MSKFEIPSLFGWEYFLNTDLVNHMLAAQIGQMGSFFVVGQVCANTVDHHHDESAIIHVQPVRAADQLISALSYKRTINIIAQVWLVKSFHDAFCPNIYRRSFQSSSE
jgi:hypothetical protein